MVCESKTPPPVAGVQGESLGFGPVSPAREMGESAGSWWGRRGKLMHIDYTYDIANIACFSVVRRAASHHFRAFWPFLSKAKF